MFAYDTWGGSWGNSWGASWGAGGVPSVSSGMRRLLLYQFQEESLNKEAAKEVKAQVQDLVTAQQIQQASKPKKPLPPLVPLIKYDLPEFKRKPIYDNPTPVEETLKANLLLSDAAWSTMLPFWQRMRDRLVEQRKKQQAAANDAEFRRRLLFLLAA